MCLLATSSRWTAAFLLTWALTPAALAAPAPAGEKAQEDSPAEKIRRALEDTITIEVRDQPLHLAINQLHEQTKLNFVLDRFTIAQMGIDPESSVVNFK